ncbi:MAG TPA: hypothetical protein VI565_04520, partial [Burkholderiales bacterium]|nr:hypothetical protein [Burkholderiales bacterium]
MTVGFSASKQESTAQAVIAQAGAALGERRSDIPPTFIAQLYGYAVPEDVARYAAADLADLAERAYDFMRERQPGAPKIRCETVRLRGSGEAKPVSVVEIVNDDMPFLLDSVMGEIAERKLAVRLVAHPLFSVRRKGQTLTDLEPVGAAEGPRESFIHIHLDAVEDAAACAELVRALHKVLTDVRMAVADWRPMLDRVNSIVNELKTNPPPLPVDEIAEAIQFMQWLLVDHFTFLGVRDYRFNGHELEPNFDTALGIMRDRDLRVLKRGQELLEITPEIMAFLNEPRPLIIAK